MRLKVKVRRTVCGPAYKYLDTDILYIYTHIHVRIRACPFNAKPFRLRDSFRVEGIWGFTIRAGSLAHFHNPSNKFRVGSTPFLPRLQHPKQPEVLTNASQHDPLQKYSIMSPNPNPIPMTHAPNINLVLKPSPIQPIFNATVHFSGPVTLLLFLLFGALTRKLACSLLCKSILSSWPLQGQRERPGRRGRENGGS